MGCDIHFYVEVLKEGTWTSVDTWKEDFYEHYGDCCSYLSVDWRLSYYSGRNYNLFAILADVRNGYGFAGSDTGDGYIPIAKPKGLPENVSPEVYKAADQWEGDGHSHSYFTVQELLNYDWTQTTKRRTWVDMETFYKCDQPNRVIEPDTGWSKIEGEAFAYITMEEARKLRNSLVPEGTPKHKAIVILERELPNYWVQLEWEAEYYLEASYFWSNTIPRLLALGAPEEVRVVFWFDN